MDSLRHHYRNLRLLEVLSRPNQPDFFFFIVMNIFFMFACRTTTRYMFQPSSSSRTAIGRRVPRLP